MSQPFDVERAGASDSWGTERILPDGFLPMLAVPVAAAPAGADFSYEVKWEGLRVLAGLEGKRLVLRTGTGQDAGFWFPELSDLRVAAEPDWVLLDGELIVVEGGLPCLPLLQQRTQALDPAGVARLAEATPVTFIAYDVLRIGDSWLLDVSWDERREILQRAVTSRGAVKVSPAAAGPGEALGWARALGLESVIAKRHRGRYFPGERTRDWLSIKPMEVVDAVIGGWTEGRGARRGSIGTLLLGQYRGNELLYIGHTGTGLDAETLRTLHVDLVRRAQSVCPFRDTPSTQAGPNWVRPELVCRVRHQGWSEIGKMRSPTFIGMSGERRPRDCRIAEEVAAGRS
jgi:bifunctional non-homologous end joining protein LigD